MFSIAAINDTESKENWEPLAPSKEAQEFHLSQTYHEGLVKLQAKDYEKAKELLESILKDPIIANSKVKTISNNNHLHHLKFLALKNLATVFLELGPTHHDDALNCYLQAIEIDGKDSVLWNHLGTLSCSMGLLSISRWAFEQGLLCSPKNWNCMEKLLEVLIAVGDEVSCLSVANMILRHWPTHSRALLVKRSIEETDLVPFAPKGIDKLEPHHARLKFPGKRKISDINEENDAPFKKLKQRVEVKLTEASWMALIDSLLGIVVSSRDADIPITIELAISKESTETVMQSVEESDCNVERECNTQERRSTRLERLRNQKPEREESEFDSTTDILQYLETFIVESGFNASRVSTVVKESDSITEHAFVTSFVKEISENYGAYHVSHLLLEYLGEHLLSCDPSALKILELEKLTRHWGRDRKPECSLFLAELYYDLDCQSNMVEVTYHLSKIIESVSLNNNIVSTPIGWEESSSDSSLKSDQTGKQLLDDKKRSFWARYFWMSGRLSIMEDNKGKALEELIRCLSLFEKEYISIQLPHCRKIRELNVDRIAYEINLLKISMLLEKTIPEMMDKELYSECVNLLSSLLFPSAERTEETNSSVEMTALDVLIKACQKSKLVDVEVYMNCHRRKLQILLDSNSSESWDHLVAEEVKSTLLCISQVKNFLDVQNATAAPRDCVAGLQSMLLTVMSNTVRRFLSKRNSDPQNSDGIEEEERKSCFLDAAIGFCKLQHLDSTISTKHQVELIIGLHDLLAEYELCCAGKNCAGEEGAFLRFAIKHLLALDMKVKSRINRTDTKKDDPEEKVGYIEKQSEEESKKISEQANEVAEKEKDDLELLINSALDQCFFCLYGLNLRVDGSPEDELAVHKNTSRGDYETKEQCVDVFQYILPYAKSSSRTGLLKLRRVLRAIKKHFPQPPDDLLNGNVIDKFLDDPDLCEEKLSYEAGSDGFLETITKCLIPNRTLSEYKESLLHSLEPYLDVYHNLYYFLAQCEDGSASDKWPGFVLAKEGEEFIQHNTNLFKYDLLYNPLRFESWQKLANIYDEEVDLLLNDGSKHINVVVWRKNVTLSQRVETSRRRSRRCLLMSLALVDSPDQQSEIHEMLALVYYDSLQSVVPFYDQRSVLPIKDATWTRFCENSMKYFKKAFAHRKDWSHAFYMGKLSQKLNQSYKITLSYYDQAMRLNPSAVDPVYRLHASRLKFLNACGKQNVDALKILASYCFNETIKDTAMAIINSTSLDESSIQMEGVWHMLYNDSLSGLGICIEGDLKHFHKARYMLSQGLYRRGGSSDLQRAKEELSFCFKSSRSSFTINMWEIDGMVKKGKRKSLGSALEVNLPESSRKFITCIRKYLLFYLRLLEETGDVNTLERAFLSLRSDKRFSLCVEDIVPVAIGRYRNALVTSVSQVDDSAGARESQLEKIFSVFIEHGSIWPDIHNGQETSESSLYRFLHQYIVSLELDNKVETLETINEKIRKRFKNLKLSNSLAAKVGRHASLAWCRALIISLASITPLQQASSAESQEMDLSIGFLENRRVLCVDIQSELWSSSFEDPSESQMLEAKWGAVLSKINNVVVHGKASDENLEMANSLLKSCYSFFRETSSVSLPCEINLYFAPTRLATEGKFLPGVEGVEVVDVSIPRKLLLWGYTLVHGHCGSISQVVKHMEENTKVKMKRGASTSSTVVPLVQSSEQEAAHKVIASVSPGGDSSVP